MRHYLYFYAILIAIYVSYHLYEPITSPRISELVDLLFLSLIFGYMAWMAWKVLRKLGK